jgi:hypothetical protein
MSSIFHTDVPARDEGMQSHLFFGAVYPLFVAAEGLTRLIASLATSDERRPEVQRPLLAQARANAAIATSYALMARTMLQSSDRKTRTERLS